MWLSFVWKSTLDELEGLTAGQPVRSAILAKAGLLALRCISAVRCSWTSTKRCRSTRSSTWLVSVTTAAGWRTTGTDDVCSRYSQTSTTRKCCSRRATDTPLASSTTRRPSAQSPATFSSSRSDDSSRRQLLINTPRPLWKSTNPASPRISKSTLVQRKSG